MPITTSTPLSPAPDVPNSNDPETTFDSMFEAFLSYLKNTFVTGINAIASACFDNATSAQASATASDASRAASDQAASVSLASANFKGQWSGLTGALSKPASTSHAGRFWLLLDNLADVTAAVPGVSASWLAFDILLPVIPVTTAYAELISGKEYSVLYTGGQVTLKMPPPGIGGAVVIDIANKRTDLVLQHNGGLFMDELALDDYTLVDPGRYAARHNGVSWRGLA